MFATAFVIRERNDQNAVCRCHADGHDRAHQRGNIERRAGDEQHPDDPAKRARQCHDDDKRIGPGLEIDGHQKVNQHDREQNACADAGERFVHAFDLAADAQECTARQLRFEFIDHFVHLISHAAKVASLHVGQYIEDRLHIVMIHNHR